MQVDNAQLSLLLLESSAFIAAFAAITAAAIMFTTRKKAGSGLMASGFQAMAIGVSLLALGMLLDTITIFVYQLKPLIFAAVFFVKNLLFIVGTYFVVVGGKRIRDNFASLTQ